jgi:thiol-disulfide isomerase/thioredoxin
MDIGSMPSHFLREAVLVSKKRELNLIIKGLVKVQQEYAGILLFHCRKVLFRGQVIRISPATLFSFKNLLYNDNLSTCDFFRPKSCKFKKETHVMKKVGVVILGFIIALLVHYPSTAELKKAPEWVISEWINGDGVTLSVLKGKVVIVEFFQLWCPGCNSFSIPLMKKWTRTFENELASSDLVILSIHTVFEGHDYQNPKRLRSFVKEKGIHHLVGIDKHEKGERIPETMKRYRTRGTPEMAIIDKKGNIRFQKFGGFDPSPVESLVKQLLNEPFVTD